MCPSALQVLTRKAKYTNGSSQDAIRYEPTKLNGSQYKCYNSRDSGKCWTKKCCSTSQYFNIVYANNVCNRECLTRAKVFIYRNQKTFIEMTCLGIPIVS